MGKYIIPFIMVSLIFTQIGCKKENENHNNDDDDASNKIKSITGITPQGSAIFNLSYNPQGLLAKVIATSGSATTTFVCEWNSNSLIYTKDNTTYTLLRNPNGYVVIDDSQGLTVNYSYDSQNRLTSIIGDNGKSINCAWSDGNIVSYTVTNNSALEYTMSAEYYTDKTENRNFGLKYWPAGFFIQYGNKNPVKKEVKSFASGGTEIIDYSYAYDTKGRITQMTKNTNGNISQTNYTYF